ncbi:hypothetical protein N5C60_01435 [Pseudomonas mosselii]|uniref:hypothetical protein n=1 Tax=Pseudomonas mosselii TaxID=78327 RepID=UPI00244AEE97|nr:hypothetical protein [Pseudomonas mosselii]MDH1143272.1 hypothetical protein [Pseudomonas mosselii]
MEITGIQIKSMQNSARTYDAIILKFNGMHFSRDLLSGEGGDRDIRQMKQMAAEFGIEIDCYEPRLQARISEALGRI